MYRISYVIIAIYILTSLYCNGQDTVITDSRDGKTYPITTIGKLQWFKSNLCYETPNSWCAQHGKGSDCKDGNFYYYNDLTNTCPDGWRLPSYNDWDTTVKLIMSKNHQNLDSLHYKQGVNKASIIVTGTNIINDKLGLDIKPTGWVQGKRRRSMRAGQANFFVVDSETQDPTTHIHAWPTSYVKHAHEFNIIDKPRKQRRLSVRCVKELD